MEGWKTKASGIAGILAGLGMLLKDIASGNFDVNNLWQAILVIIGGLSILGIGGKFQKLIDATKENGITAPTNK